MKVGDLVRFRHEEKRGSFLVVAIGSYNRLRLLKGKSKSIDIHPDWLEVVSESR